MFEYSYLYCAFSIGFLLTSFIFCIVCTVLRVMANKLHHCGRDVMF